MERKMNSFMGVGTTGCSTLLNGRALATPMHQLVLRSGASSSKGMSQLVEGNMLEIYI
jgi:hypothetical protein